MWLQGASEAPDLVKRCWARWRRLNPEYSLNILDSESVKNLLSSFPADIEALSAQTVSDIIRVKLLRENGGIWIDATVFPVIPLSEWLGELMSDRTFFAYRRDLPYDGVQGRPIAPWFLASSQDSVIISRWWKEVERYWSVAHAPISPEDEPQYLSDPIEFMGLHEESSSKPYPYHWLHHIFAFLIESDKEFANEWSKCATKTVLNAHRVQYFIREQIEYQKRPSLPFSIKKLSRLVYEDAEIRQAIESSEMQKLDWRLNFPLNYMEKITMPDTKSDRLNFSP